MSVPQGDAEAVDPSYSAPVPGRFRRPVPDGPFAFRLSIRQRGALVAPAAAAAAGLIALIALAGSGTVTRGAPGFLLAVLVAPGVLLFGAPLSHGPLVYMGGIAVSLMCWTLFGAIAARRATRRAAATWRDYWWELAWLAGAMWAGLIVALVAVDLALGRALF